MIQNIQSECHFLNFVRKYINPLCFDKFYSNQLRIIEISSLYLLLKILSLPDNEELQDLLNTSGDRKLKLCEDIKKGVVCQNLEEITVLNVGDIFEILQRGAIICHTLMDMCI